MFSGFALSSIAYKHPQELQSEKAQLTKRESLRSLCKSGKMSQAQGIAGSLVTAAGNGYHHAPTSHFISKRFVTKAEGRWPANATRLTNSHL